MITVWHNCDKVSGKIKHVMKLERFDKNEVKMRRSSLFDITIYHVIVGFRPNNYKHAFWTGLTDLVNPLAYRLSSR